MRLRIALALSLAAAALLALPAGAARAVEPNYLQLAEQGLAQLHQVWWNPLAKWYTTYPWTTRTGAGGLATAWDLAPVFEATELVAIADPTPANRAAADAIARGAERYWDPAVGGYVFLPDKHTKINAFFDDSGWLGLAFFDAYRATHERRFLRDADRAFGFIERQGWARGGGTWWDTAHEKITAEPLAAEILLGALLYRQTHDRHYLQVARRFARWADAHSWNAARSLYQRNPNDGTVLDYVEGMMIGADAVLCDALHDRTYCHRGRELAQASLAAFPPSYRWAPETDAIYLRGFLRLAQASGDRNWRRVVEGHARQAVANARDERGLWTKNWDGTYASPDRVLTDAGTLMLFAQLAAD